MFDTFYARSTLDHILGNGYSFALTDGELPAACFCVLVCKVLDNL